MNLLISHNIIDFDMFPLSTQMYINLKAAFRKGFSCQLSCIIASNLAILEIIVLDLHASHIKTSPIFKILSQAV